ncbi:MAG: metal ABC transporter ATP-binding protein [Deltaproteobacteria bacterium]|nr:metal ABC transporter ATP-binding protein [Deltaproteobacteria bacterium]
MDRTRSAQPLVKLSDVAIGYGGRPLFEGIDLEIVRGDFLALVGPNGAGKTTLLRVILGVLPPIRGKLWRRPGLRVGYVPQRAALDPIFPLSAMEVVRLGGMGPKPAGQRGHALASAGREQALVALGRLGVADLAYRPLRDLSGGQQQRVLIARALVREPDLLVLDEPAAGMDLPSERELLDFVAGLNRDHGTDIVLVVHQISLAAGRASRIALVNKDNGLFAVGAAQELLSEERLTELYGHPMEIVPARGAIVVRAGTR